MAMIRLHFGAVALSNQYLRRALRELEVIEREWESLNSAIAPEIIRQKQIGENLLKNRRAAQKMLRRTRELLRTVENGLETYRQTEVQLYNTRI